MTRALALLALAGCGPNATTAGPPPDAGVDPNATIPLPLVVTTNYMDQGWFADPAVEKFFAEGKVISQSGAVTGPCGSRMGAKRGSCLKIVYTPPATGFTPTAGGGWAGVYSLTTLAKDHPEAMPPVTAGKANWGAEPGLKVAPGATKISFYAAADSAGTAVGFQAGVMNVDSVQVPESMQSLGATWQQITLPITASYDTVVGPFAWVIHDTTKAVTFYVDDIVWDK